MRQLTVLLLAAVGTLAPAATARAGHALLVVEDPTPTGSFSGSYTERGDKPQTKKKDESRHGYQEGHVAVYEDGVVACNGSTDYAPYDQDGDGTNDPLQGYAWIGQELAASGDRNAATPGDYAGVGSNHGKLSGQPTGKPPCPEADPAGDGAEEGRRLGGCQLSATVNFAPPLTSAGRPFAYTLDGILSNCSSDDPSAPTGAVVTAGKANVTIQGVTFDEPRPSGEGGCRTAAAAGTLWTVWDDGSVTILDYSTTGVAASLVLSGRVVPSRTVTGTDGRRHTITTTRYSAGSASAAIVTRVDDPGACSGAGIPSAALDGLLALG